MTLPFGRDRAKARGASERAGARSHPDWSPSGRTTDLRGPPRRARVLSERRGRLAEMLAAVALVCRGYRILAWRHRTPQGEIDLIAVRGRRLAFVEVKHRATVGAAESSVGCSQTRRVHRAAAYWLSKRPFYSTHALGFDAIFVVPRRWPDYRPDLLQAKGTALRA